MADNEEIGHYNDQNQVSITKCRTGVKSVWHFYFYLDAPKLAADLKKSTRAVSSAKDP